LVALYAVVVVSTQRNSVSGAWGSHAAFRATLAIFGVEELAAEAVLKLLRVLTLARYSETKLPPST
jgi:hypothetical protein